MRKVVRRGKGSGEEGVLEVSLEDANELEGDAEQFMSYAILGRDSSKVGFWSAGRSLSRLELPLVGVQGARRAEMDWVKWNDTAEHHLMSLTEIHVS